MPVCECEGRTMSSVFVLRRACSRPPCLANLLPCTRQLLRCHINKEEEEGKEMRKGKRETEKRKGGRENKHSFNPWSEMQMRTLLPKILK